MILIDILQSKTTNAVPFWFMRQAGRYLAEYKKVRSQFLNFLEFCYTPEAACEVTLQPIDRFGMSAAIIFSDILVIPDALGMKVEFQESVGPVLQPLVDEKDFLNLRLGGLKEKLAPVYRALQLTRASLPSDKALIGFCGSPWTLACYMLQGKSSRDFAGARNFALRNPKIFSGLLDVLCEAVSEHAIAQIEAGANAIQLFDSWSGVLSEYEFLQYVIVPTQKIVANIRAKHPNTPIIGFPRMCGAKITDYAVQTKVNGVSFDGSVSLDFMRGNMHCAMQGNLDSQILAEDKNLAIAETKKILSSMRGKNFIFNLAHGILPHTPTDHVQAVCDVIKENT